MKKKMNNKGFTLVELIVVLVILAILAAILVPALLGYIDRAKKQQIVLNAKTYLTATQAEFSAMYGANKNSLTDALKTKIQNTADISKASSFEVKVNNGTAFQLPGGEVTAETSHKSYTIIAAKYVETGVAEPIYFANGSWDATESEYNSVTGASAAIEIK